MHTRLVAISLSAVTLLACGATKTPATTLQPGNHNEYAVSSASDLPACDAAHADWLYYVEADKTFRVCQSGAWATIDLTGPTGAKGVKGDKGDTGAAASGSLIASSISCGALLQNTTLYFFYSVDIFKSGDVFASGAISAADARIGNSQFYSAAQNGATTAQVLFTDDLLGTANAGYWSISLNRTTLVTTVVNTDADATNGSNTWTLTADKCVANSY